LALAFIMNEPDPKNKIPPQGTNTIWKLWLGIAIFIAISIMMHREANSPTGQANQEQMRRNAANAIYSDAYNSCASEPTGSTEAECREDAQHAKEMLQKRLAP
jgi:hypothetical protein